MDATMTAIEMTGTVDESHRLLLDGPLPVAGPQRVRVIVLYPLDEGLDEADWLQGAVRNPEFAYLREAEEDIYTATDGKPFDDEK